MLFNFLNYMKAKLKKEEKNIFCLYWKLDSPRISTVILLKIFSMEVSF